MPTPKTRAAQLRNVGVLATALATGTKVDLQYTDDKGKESVRVGVRPVSVERTGKAPNQVVFKVTIDGEDGLKSLRGDRIFKAGVTRKRRRK